MGIALADAAAAYGADVQLVLGPVHVYPSDQSVKVVRVTTAAEMASECTALFPGCDIAILAAAVADFTPDQVQAGKIKRSDGELNLRLKATTDIAFTLGKVRKPSQIIAGFSLETSNELENATWKLKRKNLDLIVLNSLADKGAGFDYDTNKITIIDKYNNIDKFELKSKDDAARDILDKIISMIEK